MDIPASTSPNEDNQAEDHSDKLQGNIITKLNECIQCIQAAEKYCQQATAVVSDLEKRLANESNEEKKSEAIETKLATTLIQDKVVLDVGGEKYTTSVKTLTREKNTFFTALLSKQCHIEKYPNDGSIFIDRDGKLFSHILAYLRTERVVNDIMNNDSLRELLLIEAEYFELQNLVHMLSDIFFPGGTLLKLEQKKKLNQFYGKINQRWELIYKATSDGFDANIFHSRCNNKGPTMTIVKSSNNYLFGGYTTISWTSDNSYKSDTMAFLFTLNNPHNIPPTKYIINRGTITFAVHHSSDSVATFGGGHDIYLSTNSNSNHSSYIGFPMAYIDTTRMGSKTFTGTQNFSVADIEVFRLV